MSILTKYVLPVLSVLTALTLCWLTFQVGKLDKPGLATGYYTGLAIGNLIMPLLFSTIAGFIKRSMSKDKQYDWRMFHIFLISFCFLSVIGKFAEYRNKTAPPAVEQTIK